MYTMWTVVQPLFTAAAGLLFCKIRLRNIIKIRSALL